MKTFLRASLVILLLITCIATSRAANIVFMIGEEEYHTWETLPEFAKKDLEPLGHHITIIQADATDKNRFPGIVEALRDADLLFLSVRRRTCKVASTRRFPRRIAVRRKFLAARRGKLSPHLGSPKPFWRSVPGG